ncbi:4-carboxymuconolactone decarboxylase [Exophiala sideris]|uniref:4-carboxymuconolactone decarboxylase n=1 Tax=Exophiala sideris TaxID=1016849 RepID=A0A0D1Y3C1_9EURO|nr:4-carboxymuconolactone decarboxylase [Exophiala sideris]
MASNDDKVADAHKTLYEQGLQIRREVTGTEHVQRSLQNGSSDFARPMQELATEMGWGSIWTRPGLERKTRSLLNIAMLCALNRMTELAVHVRGAVNNGVTELEIRETLMQVAAYCGLPAGLEGVRVAQKVLESIREESQSQ